MEKELGKIVSAEFGLGGYQECQVGLWITFGGKGWGVSHGYNGGWSMVPDEYAKWTVEDQDRLYAMCVRDTVKLLEDAKVRSVSELKGVPVEITFENMTIKSFRILTEVL
jgi:hypothetical protein